MTPDRFRELALELPAVSEEAHADGSYYRLRGHLIAKVPAGERAVYFFVGKDTVRARRKADRAHTSAFWTRWWRAGVPVALWVTLDSLTSDDARKLLAEACQLVPPTTLSPPDYRGGY